MTTWRKMQNISDSKITLLFKRSQKSKWGDEKNGKKYINSSPKGQWLLNVRIEKLNSVTIRKIQISSTQICQFFLGHIGKSSKV